MLIALSDLNPLKKISVDYVSPPQNLFIVHVNGADYFALPKEQLAMDLDHIEHFKCSLKINDEVAISRGEMRWIIEEITDKIDTVYKGKQPESIELSGLDCKDWVANEVLNFLVCLDLPEHGLSKLGLSRFRQQCFPIEDEVVFLLASNCPRLKTLQLAGMYELTEETRLELATGLFRQIIRNNPPLTHLNMQRFSLNKDVNESVGEAILEALYNSNIATIQNLNLSFNESWFRHPQTKEDREGILDLLVEIIY